jgi:glycosyltransferase involved in cell wall biosynthesis
MAYLVKYLPNYGWDPIVLTRRMPPGMVDRSTNVARVGRAFAMQSDRAAVVPVLSSSTVNMLKDRAREIVFFPDRAASWIPAAIAGGVRASRSFGVDAIVSSAMPASVHVAASAIASITGLPWIADYRDLWNGNPYINEPAWRKMLLYGLERFSVGSASQIVTITQSIADVLSEIHDRPVSVVPNAYDTEEWRDIPFVEPDAFRIVHAGSLYDGQRNPEPVLAQVAALRQSGEIADVRLDFYGPNPGPLLETARRLGIDDVLRYHGVTERRVAMEAERSAALLLIVQNADPRTASEYGSKVFEYQAAGRVILALGPAQSVLRSYVSSNALGWFASSDDEIRGALLEAYRAYRERRTLRADLQDVRTADSIAESFADMLDAVTTLRSPMASSSLAS